MRDRIKQQLLRARRRAILAAVCWAWGSPMTHAENPPTTPRSTLPPLPLEADGRVQANPFCEPVASDDPNSLRLVSGDSSPGQLRPVRDVVGLAPVDPTAPQQSAKEAARVQPNPYTDAADPATADPASAESTAQKFHLSDRPEYRLSDQSDEQPKIEREPEPEPEAAEQVRSVTRTLKDTRAAKRLTEPTGEETAPEETVDGASRVAHPVAIIEVTEPLIDPQSPKTGPTPETVNVRERATTGDLADADGAVEEPNSAVPAPEINAGAPPLVEPPNDEQGEQGQRSAGQPNAGQPNDGQSSDGQSSDERAGDDRAADDRAGDQPHTSQSPPRLIRPPRRVTRVPKQSDADQEPMAPAITRPPVAVVAAPVGFDQRRDDPATTIVRPAVEMLRGDQQTDLSAGESAVEDPQGNPRGTEPERPELAENTPTKSLQMKLAQVRSLAIEADLHRFHVDDTATCQVIRSGPNRLTLIGTGPGVTRLAVWADTDGGDPEAMVFDVHVQDSLSASGNDITDMARQLDESVRQVYPQATVQVRRRGDRLIVRGECGDRQTATDIVRMVRQSCLVPVVDELVIR